MTDHPAYTPVADAIDALADRVAAAGLDNPHSLPSLGDLLEQQAKAAEPYAVEVAVRLEHLAKRLRARAVAVPVAAYTVAECAELAASLRHQAVGVRWVEATHGKQRPAAAPLLDFTTALARRQQDAAAGRRERTARVVDRCTGWPRGDCGPDGGNAA